MDFDKSCERPKFLESRRLYLSVAARLRGVKLGYDHRHSVHSAVLVCDVLEADMIMRLKSSAMVAECALMSHSDVDYKQAAGSINKLYYETLEAVPYLTQGRGSDDLVADERTEAVKQFLEMRKAMGLDKPKQEESDKREIKSVG